MNILNKKSILEDAEKQPEKKWDILLKIISFIMAVLIWFGVIFFESTMIERTFPAIEVDILGLRELQAHGYNILGGGNFYVDVTLEGKNSDLSRISRSQIYAYIDLSDVERAGEIIRPVQIRDINYATVVDQNLSSAILHIDKNARKDVPVVGEIVGFWTDADTMTGDLIFTPEFVEIEGPEQLINTISHALVYADLGSAELERSRNIREGFVLINKNGDEVSNIFIRPSENMIEVVIPVYKTKEVPLRVDYRHGYYNENNVSVKINPPALVLRGSPDYLNNLDEIVIAVINEKEFDRDITLNAPISLPGDIRELNGVTSADIDIVFTDMATRTVTIPASRFNIIPPGDFQYHIQEPNLLITLFGPSNMINISPFAVSVTVDLSNYTEAGTYPVIVSATIMTEGSPVFCIGEYRIHVEIY